jgi:hypothetical protein
LKSLRNSFPTSFSGLVSDSLSDLSLVLASVSASGSDTGSFLSCQLYDSSFETDTDEGRVEDDDEAYNADFENTLEFNSGHVPGKISSLSPLLLPYSPFMYLKIWIQPFLHL